MVVIAQIQQGQYGFVRHVNRHKGLCLQQHKNFQRVIDVRRCSSQNGDIAKMEVPCVLKLGYANIPHPVKESYGGEDAFFVSDKGRGSCGVSDGVGGWAEDGINPREYSETLMQIAKRYLEYYDTDVPNGDEGREKKTDALVSELRSLCGGNDEMMVVSRKEDMRVVQIERSEFSSSSGTSSMDMMIMAEERRTVEEFEKLDDGVGDIWTKMIRAAVKEMDGMEHSRGALAMAHLLTRKPGSATACVLRMDPDKDELEATNLGDCGFMIVRDGDVVFKSPAQQHFFDCPYQFGAAPEFVDDTDTVEDAEFMKVPIKEGDAVILATDGLFDNVWPDDIVALAPKSSTEVSYSADRLAKLAFKHALNESYESPYAAAASEASITDPEMGFWENLSRISFSSGSFDIQPRKVKGGKLDDITVVVGYFGPNHDNSDDYLYECMTTVDDKISPL